jgi:hypothetical protein
LSVPVHGHSAVLLPHNGSVLVAGGTSNGTAQAGADLFLPAIFPDPFSWGVGQFAPAAAMNAARSSAIGGPTAAEGYSFVTGGGSSDVERYRFATIKTDKDDYPPGQHALITGTGWEPGEQVTLTFQEDPAVHDDYVLTLTADGQGNISTNEWAPEEHDLNVRFYLMASGQNSHRRAQITFTDSRTATAGSVTDNTVVVNEPMTASVTVQTAGSTGNDDWASTRWTFNDPAATTGCVDFEPDHTTTGTFTESFSLKAPPTVGTFSVTFTPFQNDNCSGGGGTGNLNTPITVPSIIVSAAATTTAISSDDPDPSVVGQPVTVQVAVSANAPSVGAINEGTVTIDAGGGLTCTTPTVAAGIASCQITFPTVGAKTINATYNGTANYITSTTAAGTTHTVNQASTTTVISSDLPDPSVTGQAVTVQAQVSAVAPSTGPINEGTVTINATGGLSCTTANVAAGVASCQITFPTAGAKTITATYSGTANYATSTTTAAAPHTVNGANTTTTITADTPDPSDVGQAVTVNVSVAPVAPGAGTVAEGTVTISATDAAPCTTGTLVAGVGSCQITFTASGAKTITATYNGTANYLTSTSTGAPHTVNVGNTAPFIAFTTAPTNANEGETKTYNFSITDPDAGQIFTFVSGFPDCGTGGTPGSSSINSALKTGTFQCSFPDGPASPTVRVQVQDSFSTPGISNIAAVGVTVASLAPVVALSGDTSANEGQAKHYTFTVSDVPADTYTGVASCGAGSPSNYTVTGNSGSQSGSFDCTFADGPDTPMVSITFTDDDGVAGSDNKMVTVANLAPTVVLSGDATANEGQIKHYTFTVSDVFADTYTGVASCGIVPAANYTVTSNNGSQSGSFDCTFPDGPVSPNPMVSITFTDDDGGVGSDNKEVTVANVAPSVVLSGATSANEGETKHYTFTVSDVPADTYGPGVASCGTGSLSGYTATGNSGSQSGSFDCSFPDNASTTVSVSFTDDDGGVGSDSKTVTIANLAPVVLFLSGDTTAYEGQVNAKHYTFSVIDVPADTYTGVASCGVGLTSNYTVTGNSGSRSGSFDCTWGDDATTTVSITFTDDDSGVGSDSKSVTVANVAPSNTGNSFFFNPFTGVANASISFSDPGWLDTVSATFNWAGVSAAGAPVGVGATPPGPLTGAFTGSHTFSGCVAGAISVHVEDDNLGSFDHQFAPGNALGVYTASFLAPIKDGARNIAKLGNVIPVKIQILDCHGNPVLDRTLTVLLANGYDLSEVTEGDLTIAASVSAADTGNQMRVADGFYIFNLATKGMKVAPFTIIIRDSATGTLNIATAVIDLKK